MVVRFDTEGKLRPLVIEFDEEHKYPVDRILDVRRAACQRVGGVGDRYTCLIQGKETYLWLEKGVWFVESKIWQKDCSYLGPQENSLQVEKIDKRCPKSGPFIVIIIWVQLSDLLRLAGRKNN